MFRVDHDAGPPWVARIMLTSRPLARTEEDAEILRFLERREFPAERCATPEPGHQARRPRGPGHRVPPWQAPVRQPRRVAQARRPARPAAHPARRAGPGAAPGGRAAPPAAVRGRPGRDLAAAAALLADLDGRVPAEHRQLYELIAELLPEGDDAKGLPEAFIHPDPVRNNVVVTPGGPVLVDWTGAGTGPRLASLAGLLHSAGPRHAAAALAGYREHIELTAEELDRLEGVLWIRILWLSAWQCWLACVSARVHQGFFPRREYIAALAAAVRAHSGRPA